MALPKKSLAPKTKLANQSAIDRFKYTCSTKHDYYQQINALIG